MPQLSDGQTFLLILVVFYLWEGIHWVKPGSVGYVRYVVRWRLRFASSVLYGRNRAVLFNPWPGFICPGFSAIELPFEFSPDKLIIEGNVELSWDALSLRREGSILTFGPAGKITFLGVQEAKEMENLLTSFAAISLEKRKRQIQLFYKTHLSRTKASRLIKRARMVTDSVQFNGLILMVVFFGFIPFAFITQKESLAFAGSLLVALCLLMVQAVMAYFAARRLTDGNKKYSLTVALSCLFPWHAMHVGQSLLNQALPFQHPLAVSAALLSKKQLEKHLSLYWRKQEYRRGGKSSLLFQEALDEFLERESFEKRFLLQAPRRDGNRSAAYCPSCHAQFHAGVTACSDCHGVELVEFDED
jgi:fumarate reductase subunit D